DVKAAAALVGKLGGKGLHGPETVPEVGTFLVLSDPTGAVISAYQPQSSMPPHDETKEGEFCWNELMTTDRAAAFKFYSEVFGWKTIQEMDMGPMGTYQIYGIGEKAFGGMMTAPKGSGMPSAWLHYVETGNLDAAVARATKLGP